METFTLETKRLLLRPFCPEDVADLHLYGLLKENWQ